MDNIDQLVSNYRKDDKSITQMGLYSEDPQEVERFVGRVNTFNLNNLNRPVKLNLLDMQKGDEICSRPHVKFTLQFKDKETLEQFWTS